MPIYDLADLGVYSKSKVSGDYLTAARTFYSPIDNVHGALTAVARAATTSLIIAMYGFDDQELANIVTHKIDTKGCFVQLSLDKSQAGGVHERKILAQADYPETSIAIGNSEQHAIMHMKMMIVDGVDLVTGSTNWSASGETKQDNQLTVMRDPAEAAIARSRIDAIHTSMLQQMAAVAVKAGRALDLVTLAPEL